MENYDQLNKYLDEMNQTLESEIKFEVYSFENEVDRRRQAIEDIETGIEDINKLFMDLDEYVMIQGEDIHLIDDAITTTRHHVKEAHEELVEAEQYISRSRVNSTILFGIGMAILGTLIRS